MFYINRPASVELRFLLMTDSTDALAKTVEFKKYKIVEENGVKYLLDKEECFGPSRYEILKIHQPVKDNLYDSDIYYVELKQVK